MLRVLVVGTGLIGTSVGLALQRAGDHDVFLDDVDPSHLDEAVARGAGRIWDRQARVDVAVVALPPGHTAQALTALQRRDVASTYTHTSSYQSQVQAEIEALSPDVPSVVGGHPMAGRETSGPGSASADLFVGRPWAVCPAALSSAAAAAAVTALATAVGAEPLVLTPEEHDRAVALVSHLPQVASTALASLLVERPGLVPALSGPGLVDTTRLAASAPSLWTDILAGNAREVAPAVRALSEVLARLADDLDVVADAERGEGARDRVHQLMRDGNDGRALVPVKRGRHADGFRTVPVDVDDRPGRLAGLLQAAAAAGVNVEDVRVDHVPGRPTGVISLLVAAEAASGLEEVLRADGWRVQQTSV